MRKPRPADLLRQRIKILELRQKTEEQELITEFKLAYESLNPLNLIKNTIKDFTSSPDLKSDVVKTVVGIASGFFANRLLLGSSTGLIKKAAGLAVEFGLVKLVTENADTIKSTAGNWIKSLLKKKKKRKESKSNNTENSEE